MSPIVGVLIAILAASACIFLAPDSKPKPKTAKDNLDAAMRQYLDESKKK